MGSSFSWWRPWGNGGNDSSEPARAKEAPIEKGKKLTEYLYELYSPDSGSPEVDIVFFHGLQLSSYENAYWDTWSSDGGRTVWQKTLLAKRFPKARIFSLSYNTSALVENASVKLLVKGERKEVGNKQTVDKIGESIVQDIILNDFDHVPVGKRCPVVLVGHSLGGFVIKKFLLSAHEKMLGADKSSESEVSDSEAIKTFIDNLAGIFYYSTPHGGSDLADYVEILRTNFSKLDNVTTPMVNILTTLNDDASDLNEDFRKWRENNNISSSTLCENLDTKMFTISRRVVTAASARRDTGDFTFTREADHFTVCKPTSHTSASFQNLEVFIRKHVKPLHEVSMSEDNIQ